MVKQRATRPCGDDGAAAIEFALVVPILIALVFGIIDYGLWFSDSLSLRYGVREGARQGVVEVFDEPGSGCVGSDMKRLACLTEQRIGAVGGPSFVRVETIGGWAEGNDLIICAAVKEDGLTGFTPMPKGGLLHTSMRMRIETDNNNHPGSGQTGTPPGGWAWCG